MRRLFLVRVILATMLLTIVAVPGVNAQGAGPAYHMSLQVLSQTSENVASGDLAAFAEGNSHHFKSPYGPQSGSLQVTLTPGLERKNFYKAVGAVKYDQETLPISGESMLFDYQAKGHLFKVGRIVTMAKGTGTEIPVTMFVFFDTANPGNGYASAVIGDLGDAKGQALVQFGDKIDSYRQWVDQGSPFVTDESSATSEHSLASVSALATSSDSQWELQVNASTSVINRLSYPYGTGTTSSPILYLNMLRRDPRVTGTTEGQETLRVVGQNQVVAQYYGSGIKSAKMTWVDLDFWWDRTNVASVSAAYPESSFNFSTIMSIFDFLTPSPGTQLANIVVSAMGTATPEISDSNGDGMPNKVRYQTQVGSQNSIPTGTATSDSYKYDGGTYFRVAYREWVGQTDSWQVNTWVTGDFLVTKTDYTTFLTRTNAVQASHTVRK